MSEDLREHLAYMLGFQKEAGYVTVATADLVAAVRHYAAQQLRAAADDPDTRLYGPGHLRVLADALATTCDRCTCGEAWVGHPNPHAATCPEHIR